MAPTGENKVSTVLQASLTDDKDAAARDNFAALYACWQLLDRVPTATEPHACRRGAKCWRV